MAQFDRSNTSFCSPSIVTMALAILYRLRDTCIATYWLKIAKFLYPTYIQRPRRGWPRRNFVNMFDAGKTRMIGLPCGEKLWQYVKPFSSDTGTWRTDRRTDRIAISVSRWRATIRLYLVNPLEVKRSVCYTSPYITHMQRIIIMNIKRSEVVTQLPDWDGAFYTVSQKNVPSLTGYSFNTHPPINIYF